MKAARRHVLRPSPPLHAAAADPIEGVGWGEGGGASQGEIRRGCGGDSRGEEAQAGGGGEGENLEHSRNPPGTQLCGPPSQLVLRSGGFPSSTCSFLFALPHCRILHLVIQQDGPGEGKSVTDLGLPTSCAEMSAEGLIKTERERGQSRGEGGIGRGRGRGARQIVTKEHRVRCKTRTERDARF